MSINHLETLSRLEYYQLPLPIQFDPSDIHFGVLDFLALKLSLLLNENID